jgi:hypothetical protein
LLTGAAGLKKSGYDPDTSILNDPSVNGSVGFQAAQTAAAVSFLGSAATATDRYNASVAKLNVEIANNANLTSLQGRALQGLDLEKQASEQSSYVNALGEFATIQDKATLASLNFQKAQLTNPRLTNDQRDAVVALTLANDEWSRSNSQAQVGVFNLDAATKAASDQFKAQQAPGGLLDHASPEQLAAAWQSYANKIVATGDAAAVAGSKFPQLTQLGLDAGNINKQLDTFATTSLNAVSPALQDMLNGTTSLSAGFQNLGLTVVKALENMIIQMTIIKPLASSLSGLFSLGGFGTGTVANGGIVLGGAGGPGLFAAAGGGSFGPGWGIVGEQGPELINVHSAGVTVIPNEASKAMLPGFAAGGSLSSSGAVKRLVSSGGSSASISFGDINISIPPGTDTTNAANIAATVKPMIAQVVNEQLQYHMRPRGMLNRVA